MTVLTLWSRRGVSVLVVTAIAFAGATGGAHAQEVRAAMTETCPTSTGPDTPPGAEALPALLGPILASFAGSLVDTGVAALKKAVNPEAVTMGGSFLQSGLYLWELPPGKDGNEPDITKAKVRLNPKIGCLVVAVGEFDKNTEQWELPFTVPNAKKATALTDLKSLFGLSAPPSLLFEASFTTSDDRSAVTWRPRRLYVSQFLNSSFWAGRSRGLQISFALTRPGGEKAVYSQEFKFDSVAKGFNRLDAELDGGQQGTWGVLPANAKDKPLGKPSRSTALDPFTLAVQLVETPKPYKLAQAFVGAVEANKDTIKTEMTLLVDPAKRDAAEKAAAAAVLTSKDGSVAAVQAYLDAWKTASDSCATSKVADAVGSLSCKLALDKAAVAKAKADAACGSTDAQACTSMSTLALPPPVKP